MPIVTALFFNTAAYASACNDWPQKLTSGDGIWNAVNTNDGNGNEYQRIFQFKTDSSGKPSATMLPGSLRYGSVTKSTVTIRDGNLIIEFTDSRGDHKQVYTCDGNMNSLKGRANGPTDMNSYNHSAVLSKLDGWEPPRPPAEQTASDGSDNVW